MKSNIINEANVKNLMDNVKLEIEIAGLSKLVDWFLDQKTDSPAYIKKVFKWLIIECEKLEEELFISKGAFVINHTAWKITKSNQSDDLIERLEIKEMVEVVVVLNNYHSELKNYLCQ